MGGSVILIGEMTERLMVEVLKTFECNSSVGSNPTLAAKCDT